MRNFQLSLIALLILILAVFPLAGCMPASENGDWKDKYETLQIEYTISKAELDTVKSGLEYQRTTSKTLRDDYETLKTEYNTLKADYTTIEAASNKLQADYNVLQANYDTLKANYDTLKVDYALSEVVYDAQKATYDSLKEDYDVLKVLYDDLSNTLTPAPTPAQQTWIDTYEATYGELPLVPDWLAPIIKELDASDRIRQGITLTTPSLQWWGQLLPSQKQMVLELVSWLGGYPEDYEWKIYQMTPGSG